MLRLPRPAPAPRSGARAAKDAESSGWRWWRIAFGVIALGGLMFAVLNARARGDDLGETFMAPLRAANERIAHHGDYVQV